MGRLWINALGLALMVFTMSTAQEVPSGLHGLSFNANGELVYTDSTGRVFVEEKASPRFTLNQIRGGIKGTAVGIAFDFGDTTFSGKIYFGLYPVDQVYPYPVYARRYARIENGRAELDIKKNLSGIYDISGWEDGGSCKLGYRIINDEGGIIYDGKVNFSATAPFTIDTCIIEGPFVNLVTDSSAVISWESNFPARGVVELAGKKYAEDEANTHHELMLSGLAPDAAHDYKLTCGSSVEDLSFRTSPRRGSRKKFTFAYASDARANSGGGERNLGGANAYIMKRIAGMCADRGVRFMQFTGDLISGYKIDAGQIGLEYANWKHAVEPYAGRIPFIAGFGNHEALMRVIDVDGRLIEVDRFPYASSSAEAIFANQFVNPHNGPDPEGGDFPPYDETAFYYTYDNIAVVTLNSNYWDSPNIWDFPGVGGNLHGFIMDKQLQWLKEILRAFEADDMIDHIFVTLHTPIFPNGGHVSDDMWYDGNNEPRPVISGKPYHVGIIERRDELLNILLNGSSKVVAVLTGDEHNYSRLRIDENMPMYPDGWSGQRLTIPRTIWQINNGAAGAPYYGREKTPWETNLEAFSTQNALVLIEVYGSKVAVKVTNPDTFEQIDAFILRP